jgi:hypothetical protein
MRLRSSGKSPERYREAAVPADEIESFTAEATAGDYNHLLATVMDWVEVS